MVFWAKFLSFDALKYDFFAKNIYNPNFFFTEFKRYYITQKKNLFFFIKRKFYFKS